MASFLNTIFILAVIYSKLSSYSSSFLYVITEGNLSSENKLNFSIYVKSFEGVFLCSVDSSKNNFAIMVKTGNDNKKYIHIMFHNKSKKLNLRDTCGFEDCSEKYIRFEIEWNKTEILLKCNNQLLQHILFINFKIPKYEIISPIPKSISKSTNKVYFIIGNVGPYSNEDEIDIKPVKEQLIGCLVSFNFNFEKLSFERYGTKVLTACPWKCNNNTCNGGLCDENNSPYDIITCDCSFTPLNGRYCNQSLQSYIEGENNSYRKMEQPENINVKMTWGQTLSKIYCLMEFVTKHVYVVIWINKLNLEVDNTIISQININEINYINVYITNNNLIIKFLDKQSMINFFLDENTRINIGFSEKNKTCELYQGLYDFHYNMNEVIKWIGNKSIIEIENPKGIWYLFGNKILVSVALVTIGILIFCIVLVVVYRRKRNFPKDNLNELRERSNKRRDMFYNNQYLAQPYYGDYDQDVAGVYDQDGCRVYNKGVDDEGIYDRIVSVATDQEGDNDFPAPLYMPMTSAPPESINEITNSQRDYTFPEPRYMPMASSPPDFISEM